MRKKFNKNKYHFHNIKRIKKVINKNKKKQYSLNLIIYHILNYKKKVNNIWLNTIKYVEEI